MEQQTSRLSPCLAGRLVSGATTTYCCIVVAEHSASVTPWRLRYEPSVLKTWLLDVKSIARRAISQDRMYDVARCSTAVCIISLPHRIFRRSESAKTHRAIRHKALPSQTRHASARTRTGTLSPGRAVDSHATLAVLWLFQRRGNYNRPHWIAKPQH